MAPAPLSLKGRALRWLAQREHSRAELERKLRSHLAQQARSAADPAPAVERRETDEVHRPLSNGNEQSGTAALAHDDTGFAGLAELLDELEAKGFLSDARTAESLLAGKGQRLGRHRLKQELRRLGLAEPLMAVTLAKASQTEAQRAHDIWRRKFGATPAADAAERARQARFLAARGFSAELIGRIVRGLEQET